MWLIIKLIICNIILFYYNILNEKVHIENLLFSNNDNSINNNKFFKVIIWQN